MQQRFGIPAFLHSCILALLLVSVPLSSEAAVADYLGRPIAAVRIEIEGVSTSDTAITQLVETRVGQALSMAAVRESVVHLFSLGRFEDVRVDATMADSGVTLSYQLSPIHPVSKIEFAGRTNAPGVDTGDLRRTLQDRFGLSPTLARGTEISRQVGDDLHERGYLNPTVTAKPVIEHNPDRATLVITIDPGPRTVIGDVRFAGAPDIPEADLRRQLGLAQGEPYQPVALNARIDRYVASHKSRGYYEAKIGSEVQLTDGDRVANLTLTINSGPHVRVNFTGDPLPGDRRAELVPIEREGSADQDLLEDSSNRIEEYLHGLGFRDAKAPYMRSESNGELDVTFNVQKGPGYRVTEYAIAGNATIPLQDLQPLLRLREGQPFTATRLDADVAAIEDLYRRRGFATARAVASIESETPREGGDVSVTVRIDVREGGRTEVRSIKIDGNSSMSEATIRDMFSLRPGSPYIESQLRADLDALQQAYANRGFVNMTVDAAPSFSADRSEADVALSVREGPRIFVDHVLIVGNVRTGTDTIERELQIKPGDPWSPSAINESQRRLASLGLFRRTRMNELRHGDENRRDLLVTVEEAPATTVAYGGGVEAQRRVYGGVVEPRFDVAPRASFQVDRRNLFGKNRSVSFFTSISEHVRDVPTEYRVLATYREPRVFDTTADAFFAGVYEQQIRTSFAFRRRSLNAGLAKQVTRQFLLSGGYQIQRTETFNETINDADKPLVDRLFPKLRLSSFQVSGVHDTRDDPVDATRGHYLAANGQLAARAIGSEVGFFKTFFTAQSFYAPPRASRLVFATSARAGLARAFIREGQTDDRLPPSERFYAGGDTTVRGYTIDTLATPETRDIFGIPIGGNAVVILNGEARLRVRGGVGVVGFLDVGNVFARPSDINVPQLRPAVGFGLRYRSPIGPLRVDLGFKLHPDEIIPGVVEDRTAIHITLGQAF